MCGFGSWDCLLIISLIAGIREQREFRSLLPIRLQSVCNLQRVVNSKPPRFKIVQPAVFELPSQSVVHTSWRAGERANLFLGIAPGLGYNTPFTSLRS